MTNLTQAALRWLEDTECPAPVQTIYGDEDLRRIGREYATGDAAEHVIIRNLLDDMRTQILARDTQYDRARMARMLLAATQEETS